MLISSSGRCAIDELSRVICSNLCVSVCARYVAMSHGRALSLATWLLQGRLAAIANRCLDQLDTIRRVWHLVARFDCHVVGEEHARSDAS